MNFFLESTTFTVFLVAVMFVIVALTTSLLIEIKGQTRRAQSRLFNYRHQIKRRQIKRFIVAEKQQVAETAVEQGTNTVEFVHKSISGLTFGILDSIPATRHGSRIVKTVHDETSSTVYEKVRQLNRWAGQIAKNGF